MYIDHPFIGTRKIYEKLILEKIIMSMVNTGGFLNREAVSLQQRKISRGYSHKNKGND